MCEHNWHFVTMCRFIGEPRSMMNIAKFICDKCGETKYKESNE